MKLAKRHVLFIYVVPACFILSVFLFLCNFNTKINYHKNDIVQFFVQRSLALNFLYKVNNFLHSTFALNKPIVYYYYYYDDDDGQQHAIYIINIYILNT